MSGTRNINELKDTLDGLNEKDRITVIDTLPIVETEKATVLLYRKDGDMRLLICDTTKWYQVKLEEMT